MKNTWNTIDGKLVKEFTFKDFTSCVEFIQKIHPLAEKMDHHPDIFLHSYKKVRIILFTHSRNKLTDLDYSLAKQIDKI